MAGRTTSVRLNRLGFRGEEPGAPDPVCGNGLLEEGEECDEGDANSFEGDCVVEAITETLTIGRQTQLPVAISHHKCAGPANYGRSRETLAMIDDLARSYVAGKIRKVANRDDFLAPNVNRTIFEIAIAVVIIDGLRP